MRQQSWKAGPMHWRPLYFVMYNNLEWVPGRGFGCSTGGAGEFDSRWDDLGFPETGKVAAQQQSQISCHDPTDQGTEKPVCTNSCCSLAFALNATDQVSNARGCVSGWTSWSRWWNPLGTEGKFPWHHASCQTKVTHAVTVAFIGSAACSNYRTT